MLTANFNAPVLALRRHWIKLSVATVLIATYAVAGFYWVPTLIREQASKYVETELHRHLLLGEVSFNPFTLTTRIHNIELDEANNNPIAKINELLINAELSSLWQRAFVFKQVRIDSPAISAIIDAQGNLNLAALKPESKADESSSSTPPRVHIGQFELLKGELKLVDRSRPQVFDVALKPITFTLQNFRTEHDHENAFHFAATSDEKESLDWRGDFTMQPFAANGTLKLGGLKATTIQSYLQDKLPFLLSAGTLDVEGKYAINTDKYFDIKLALNSIHIGDAHLRPTVQEDQSDWLVLPQVNITDTAISLHDRSIDIKTINVDDAAIQAWLNEQRQLNLLQLLPAGGDDGAKWNTRIASINLNRATIHAEDRSVQPVAPFTLGAAQVQLQNFTTPAKSPMSVNAQLTINDSGKLTAQGEVRLDTLFTTLQLHLAEFPLSAMQNYAAQSTDIVINGGTLNTEGTVTYKGNADNKVPLLQYSGFVQIDNLITKDKVAGGDFVKWRQLQLHSFKYAMSPDQLSIDKIVARDVYGRMAIYSDATTNVQHALRLPASKADENSKQASKPVDTPTPPAMKIQIAKVAIENSELDFSDESIEPSFATAMQHLNGDITGLSTNNASRAMVNLKGNIDNYAPVSINGDVNFLAASAFSDISMDFSNIDLTTINPYSGKFAGYNIEKGKLATKLHYSIVDRKLDAQHHIVVDQLEFGKATESKDAVSLPIKLAVALLKDRNGVIELDLPVSGSLDDPEFHAGSIVWKAFKNLLTKIVTSPFAALGSLFGGGEEMAYVDFAPGSAVIGDDAKEKLNKLARALIERPQLKLDIPLTTVTDADAQVMAKMALQKAIAKQLHDATVPTPQQTLDALIAVYKEKTGNLPEFSTANDKSVDVTALQIAALEKQLLSQFVVSSNDRNELATQRATVVQTALLSNTELAPERIFKVATDHSAKSPAGVVRMELKLE